MEKEVLFWSRYNYAVSSFCEGVLLEEDSAGKLIEAIVGEGSLPLFASLLRCGDDHFVARCRLVWISCIALYHPACNLERGRLS